MWGPPQFGESKVAGLLASMPKSVRDLAYGNRLKWYKETKGSEMG